MGSFDRDSKFKSNAGFSRVLFGRQKPITELELNETQLIQNNQVRRLIENMLGDGVNDLSAFTYENSVLTIGDCFFSCSGFLIKNTGLSIDLADSETAYLQVWEETVTYQDTLKEEGNEQSSVTVDNTILDEDMCGETTQRKVVKYTLSNEVDSDKYNLAVAKVTGGSLEVLVNNIKSSNLYELIGKAVVNANTYTDNKIADLINGAPTTLDTLKEIADAMAEHEDVVEALEKAVGNKANTSDLTSHTGNASNPHSVTKAQVGLGNVPNVATNDQTPSYTVASANAELTSGEKLSVAFGKIAKAIASLISHLSNTSNPHSVTKAHLGLGSVENKSSATIRGELTKSDVTTALGYTPPTTDTNTWRPLGTTSDTACAGNDSRLSNARPASDVYSWAKASSKPSYTKAEVGLGNVDNTADSAKSVNYANSAGSASGANFSNQLQAFTGDNFSGGDHFVKAIRGSGWSTHLWMCYNGGAAQADAVSVNYANSAGSATVSAKLGRGGDVSVPMVFNWSGQSGQPSWLWGGEDGTNMYVYNPANFNVSYATSAGSASSATNATNAGYASVTTPTTASLKNIYAGTAELTAGSSALTTGTIYVQYE